MDQKEICIKLINCINDAFDNIYRLFTKDTTYYLINEHQDLSFNQIIEYLKQINSKIEILDTLQSSVCVKVITKCKDRGINFYVSVKNRRIDHLEIESYLI